MSDTPITRSITGIQKYTDPTLNANSTEVRQIHTVEIRDKIVRIVNDMDNHIGNYGNHHKDVDDTNSGFMNPEQKNLLTEHTTDHTGPNGASHALASDTRHGFESKEDYTAWHAHLSKGGTEQHPSVSNTLEGFMTPTQKLLLEKINSDYVTNDVFESGKFKVYLISRSSPTYALGYDSKTSNFTMTIPRTPLETQAGRQLVIDKNIYPVSYTVNSTMYSWSTPFTVADTIAYNSGSDIVVGLNMSTFYRGYNHRGALQYDITVALIPANSVVWLS